MRGSYSDVRILQPGCAENLWRTSALHAHAARCSRWREPVLEWLTGGCLVVSSVKIVCWGWNDVRPYYFRA